MLTTITAHNVRRDTVEDVVAFTRLAYANSDPLPGLPTPDGAVEGVPQLLRFLDDGGSVRVARTDHGVAGVLRTSVLPDGALWVSRVAVAPATRGRGIGARLMAAVEDLAAAEGFRTVRLDAVIERCLVPYYTRLGYRIASYHPPDDGKPLTEAGMERDLIRPREPMPHQGPDPGASQVLAWYVTPTGTTAVITAVTDPAGHRGHLAGVDAWLGEPGALPDLLRAAPGARPTRDPCVVEFAADRADIPLHVHPRMSHGDLWAIVRFRPGHERIMPTPDIQE